jgi:outer membrane lipopolysaccharide assembly protein LptE/RlpB
MNAARLYVWSAVLMCLCLSGCGYRLARFDNPALDGITTIAIPYFENKSYEPGIDAIFTHAFVNKFVATKQLQVVAADKADAVLRGSIKKVDHDSLAMTQDRRALEWRIWVTISIVVEERATGRVLWKRSALRHSEEFRTGAEDQVDIQLDEADKRRAFQDLAADLAERVHDGLMQGF